jgi:hypothetical protein
MNRLRGEAVGVPAYRQAGKALEERGSFRYGKPSLAQNPAGLPPHVGSIPASGTNNFNKLIVSAFRLWKALFFADCNHFVTIPNFFTNSAQP